MSNSFIQVHSGEKLLLLQIHEVLHRLNLASSFCSAHKHHHTQAASSIQDLHPSHLMTSIHPSSKTGTCVYCRWQRLVDRFAPTHLVDLDMRLCMSSRSAIVRAVCRERRDHYGLRADDVGPDGTRERSGPATADREPSSRCSLYMPESGSGFFVSVCPLA